jgi:hypothetical protein
MSLCVRRRAVASSHGQSARMTLQHFEGGLQGPRRGFADGYMGNGQQAADFASAMSIPRLQPRVPAEPPSRVSLPEPGGLAPWPQSIRSSPSCTSTMIGSNPQTKHIGRKAEPPQRELFHAAHRVSPTSRQRRSAPAWVGAQDRARVKSPATGGRSADNAQTCCITEGARPMPLRGASSQLCGARARG